MPRPCTVCTHPERTAINQALVANEPIPRISAVYRVSEDALTRHKRAHIPALLARAQAAETAHGAALAEQVADQEAAADAAAVDVMAELHRCLVRVNLLFDACDRWLRDPDNPEQYDVGPRAEDVTVTYWAPGPTGRPIRKKAKLSRLLARLEDAGTDVDHGETRHADPRDLLLKTADRLQASLELLARLTKQLDERPTVNILLAPEWVSVRTVLLQSLQPFPDARAAVAASLMRLEAGNGHGG